MQSHSSLLWSSWSGITLLVHTVNTKDMNGEDLPLKNNKLSLLRLLSDWSNMQLLDLLSELFKNSSIDTSTEQWTEESTDTCFQNVWMPQSTYSLISLQLESSSRCSLMIFMYSTAGYFMVSTEFSMMGSDFSVFSWSWSTWATGSLFSLHASSSCSTSS